MSTTPKVTGTTITDEQLRQLRAIGSTPVTGNGVEYACGIALGEIPVEVPDIVTGPESRALVRTQEREAALERCADAWNARHALAANV
jgi:hypothetical protein